jgi:hypothetical protein
MLVLYEKTGENTEFDFAQKMRISLDAAFANLCIHGTIYVPAAGCAKYRVNL